MKLPLSGSFGLEVSSQIIRTSRSTDRTHIIDLINTVAAERQYLQTDHYCPTPAWEQILTEGHNRNAGLLLLVVEIEQRIVGFARLTADWEYAQRRSVGNIGMALLPGYRSVGIGSSLLRELIARAPDLGFQKLNAAILSTNEPSRRLFEKNGFLVARSQKVRVPFKNRAVEELLVDLQIAV